jgi:hypothetical protein
MDFPNSTPGIDLRNITINHGQVKGLRVSLFTKKPAGDQGGCRPKLAAALRNIPCRLNRRAEVEFQGKPGGCQPAAGPNHRYNPQLRLLRRPTRLRLCIPRPPFQLRELLRRQPCKPVPVVPALPPPPRMSVDFKNGKLKIFSDRASLAEVLAEVRRRTGADIGIPPGASQEQVFGTLGPGAPRDVMAALLNGSHFNFVMVGTDRDPTQLRSVLLTPRDGAPSSVPATTEPQQPAVVEPQPEANENAGAPEAPAIVGRHPDSRSRGRTHPTRKHR